MMEPHCSTTCHWGTVGGGGEDGGKGERRKGEREGGKEGEKGRMEGGEEGQKGEGEGWGIKDHARKRISPRTTFQLQVVGGYVLNFNSHQTSTLGHTIRSIIASCTYQV